MKYLKQLGAGLLLLLSSHAFSQKTTPSLLYEVSGKGLAKPSYLYGTFHLLCQKDLQISPVALEKLKGTEQLYLEIDMDDPKELSSMMSSMYLKGQTLKDLVSEADYDYLNQFFKDSLKTNLESMKQMKPFVLMSMIYPKMLGCTPGSPELVFMQKAATDKKPVLGLEKAADQFAVIDKPGPKKGAEQLVKYVREYGHSQEEFNTMLELYRKQDIEALYEASEKDPDFKDQLQDLLWQRNSNWIPVITKSIHEKPSFIAVGAAHLGGPKGVLALLKEQGYTVKSVNTSAN